MPCVHFRWERMFFLQTVLFEYTLWLNKSPVRLSPHSTVKYIPRCHTRAKFQSELSVLFDYFGCRRESCGIKRTGPRHRQQIRRRRVVIMCDGWEQRVPHSAQILPSAIFSFHTFHTQMLEMNVERDVYRMLKLVCFSDRPWKILQLSGHAATDLFRFLCNMWCSWNPGPEPHLPLK